MKESVFTKLYILALIWISAVFVCIFLDNSKAVLLAAAIFSLVYVFSLFRRERFETISGFCFRYRWALALAFFLICLCFKLSGSSIGIYDSYLPTKISEVKSTLFGRSRIIRSDEWAVQTPTFFSQYFNDFGLYSNRISLSPTNMVIDYYAPVWDITAIGKPLFWGYLLFGNEVGLSWYWCGQLILLFMLSLEMFLVVLKNSRKLSVLGALMIALSPNIQWWFLPHMPVVLLYASGLFVVGYHFFTATKDRYRALLAAASVIAAVGFALSIFPSYQVPCAYIVIALLVACLYRDRRKITFSPGKWFFIAVPAGTVILILAHFYMTSREAVQTLLNSVYPGKRMCLGGNYSVSSLFTNLSSFTLPYASVNYLNNCEVSDSIHFAPFFILLAPQMFIGLKKRGESIAVGVTMCVALVLTAVFMVFGIPQWLAEITLLRFCNRMNGVYGWLSVIFTVYGFDMLLRYPDILKKWQRIVYPLLYGIVAFSTVDDNVYSYFSTFFPLRGFSTFAVTAEIAALTLILIFVAFSKKKLMAATLVAIMFLSGGTVNPIERGTTAITNRPLYAAVQETRKTDPDALWVNMTDAFFLSNYLAASGARVIDATNFYFDAGKWKIIDPKGEYAEAENRYSNQSAALTSERNSVELVFLDRINFLITPDTLKELGIRYIFTDKDYDGLLTEHGISYTCTAIQDQYCIYELIY